MVQKTCFLIGNPNTGKSSLFNQLTGIYQKIANYPGVTTEKKYGTTIIDDIEFTFIDLPGCYSLYPNTLDEKVVLDELLHSSVDCIIFVADASQLHRNLLLYSQVADFNIPIVLVMNMTDELKRKGMQYDQDFLQNELGCTIFACNSKSGKGIESLKQFLGKGQFYSSNIIFGDQNLFSNYIDSPTLNYRKWHEFVTHSANNAIVENVKRRETISRYSKIEKIIDLTMQKTPEAFRQKKFSETLDMYVMHPILGYFVLILILFVVFQSLFTVAQYPMEWLDRGFGFLSDYIISFYPNSLFIKFLTEAIIPGLAGILIFIPQIALLFLFNTILEESGYMARMVFLLDHGMRKFGMSGKSILPLLSGNACAIPAIASTKAIPTQKERLITILSIPFMTCSARLPVYTLLISIVIPLRFQALSLLGLYLIGAIFALFFGWIANQVIPSKENSFLILEMPPYRRPSFKNIIINIKNSVFPFVKVAGKFILSISIFLWFLAGFNWNSSTYSFQKTTIEHSMAAKVGHAIEPIILPLGYDWKIGVALVSSFAAREVFVSTLATLYRIDDEATTGSIITKMKEQIHPITHQRMFNLATGVSLLLFYAFALQCMSTLAAIYKETKSWKYPLISFFGMSCLAYFFAFISYQCLK